MYVIQRNTKTDTFINTFQPELLEIQRSNIDIKPVTDEKIALYLSKMLHPILTSKEYLLTSLKYNTKKDDKVNKLLYLTKNSKLNM